MLHLFDKNKVKKKVRVAAGFMMVNLSLIQRFSRKFKDNLRNKQIETLCQYVLIVIVNNCISKSFEKSLKIQQLMKYCCFYQYYE